MDYLPSIKIIDNNEMEVYANKNYPSDFITRLSNNFIKKRKRILDFFDLPNFRKVRINLFENIENYRDFSIQFISISSFSTGNCCQGMINYVCNDSDLLEKNKAGYLIASIAHEFVHLVYNEEISTNHCIWFEEGLAQYLSGQKSFIEVDDIKYNNWLNKAVLSKEIPPIEFLKKRGGNYGEFCDCHTNKYNGYDIGYALVKFMTEIYTKQDIINFAKNIEDLERIEHNILYDFKNKNNKEI